MTTICHLVDDTSPGGVTRMLAFIQGSDRMRRLGSHEVVVSPAGLRVPPKVTADIIVSHIVLSWRNVPFFLALRARYPRKTIIHIEHHYSPAFVAAEVAHQDRFRTMLQVSMRAFDRVIAISTAQRDWLADFAGLAERKLVLIPSCVAIDEFLQIAPPAFPIRKIGAIGRLHPQKGFDVLIPAFRKANLHDVTLEIYGDGPDRALLEKLADHDPAITFHGYLPDPAAALAAVDAVAMPSRREPYGLVALEAMAAGRPLLVSEADGLRDHADLGAIAVPALTVDAWADALQTLCQSSTGDAAKAARARVAGAEDRFADAWETLLANVS